MIRNRHFDSVSERIADILGSDTDRFSCGLLALAMLLAIGAGCSPFVQDAPRAERVSRGGHALTTASLPRLLHHVRPSLKAHLGQREAEARRAVSAPAKAPAAFTHPRVVHVMSDPWAGLGAIEEVGLALAASADQRSIDFGALLGILVGPAARRSVEQDPWNFPMGTNLQRHLDFAEQVLLKAEDLKEAALKRLSATERAFLFEHAATLVREFTPQLSEASREEEARLQAAHRFCHAFDARVDYDKLIQATELLLRLAHEPWLHAVAQAANRHAGSPSKVEGFTGQILAVRDTRAGLIVIGGPGKNIYALGQGVALVLDVGGSDIYRGRIGAAHSMQDGNRLVIDVEGNDRYEASSLGLGTGRLAVGLVVDAGGNDTYRLARGSGGTGFAGIGVLYDLSGDDRYDGATLTQGAAIAGLGLLLDRTGRDEFTSEGYGIGFGGPLGVGAVVETGGDDRYVCGGTFPSAYNATDAPAAKLADEDFQYQGFCLGVGVGMRMLGEASALTESQLAGGVGLLIDTSGNDDHRSSNFSQGTGYFWGAGLMLDLAGDDRHRGARYGHGASAHHAVGLFIDAAGRDVYGSSGPLFNAGTAWDHSIALFLDAGSDDDLYGFSRSDGLGRSARTSWSLAVEEGGNDRYEVSKGLGLADENSVSGFFDLEGRDRYVLTAASPSFLPDDEVTLTRDGGVFIDR